MSGRKFSFLGFCMYLCLIAMGPTLAVSQTNIKVGYNARFLQSNVANDIFSRFNERQPMLEQGFTNIGTLSGLELGFRYKFSTYFAAELSYVTTNPKRNIAIIENPNGGFTNVRWNTSMKDYSASIETYFSRGLGLGSSIGFTNVKFTQTLTGLRRPREELSDFFHFGKIYMIFEVFSSKMSLCVKPYYYFPLSTVNLTVMDQKLNPSLAPDPAGYNEKFRALGISLVFYNGPQTK
jgi:hypothetical protein